jgi:hypothetical protein
MPRTCTTFNRQEAFRVPLTTISLGREEEEEEVCSHLFISRSIARISLTSKNHQTFI